MHVEISRNPEIPVAAPPVIPVMALFQLCLPETCRQMRDGYNLGKYCDWLAVLVDSSGVWHSGDKVHGPPLPPSLQRGLGEIRGNEPLGDFIDLFVLCDECDGEADVRAIVALPEWDDRVFSCRVQTVLEELYDHRNEILNAMCCRIGPSWQGAYRAAIERRWD